MTKAKAARERVDKLKAESDGNGAAGEPQTGDSGPVRPHETPDASASLTGESDAGKEQA